MALLKAGDLKLLTQYLQRVDVQMTAFLTLVAIEQVSMIRTAIILWATYLKSLCVKGHLM